MYITLCSVSHRKQTICSSYANGIVECMKTTTTNSQSTFTHTHTHMNMKKKNVCRTVRVFASKLLFHWTQKCLLLFCWKQKKEHFKRNDFFSLAWNNKYNYILYCGFLIESYYIPLCIVCVCVYNSFTFPSVLRLCCVRFLSLSSNVKRRRKKKNYSVSPEKTENSRLFLVSNGTHV